MAGFSPSHFSARFRAATGFSVLEYLKRLRMARARQLLIVTENSIAEIAAAVGYPDSFYFSRQFSAVNHISPREFRARSHEESEPRSPRPSGHSGPSSAGGGRSDSTWARSSRMPPCPAWIGGRRCETLRAASRRPPEPRSLHDRGRVRPYDEPHRRAGGLQPAARRPVGPARRGPRLTGTCSSGGCCSATGCSMSVARSCRSWPTTAG